MDTDCQKFSNRCGSWAGSEHVWFGSARYSLSYLRSLQDQTVAAMPGLGLAVGCGVNEETNQVELDIPEATDAALRLLAELDPTDDAILVRVGPAASTDQLQEPGAGKKWSLPDKFVDFWRPVRYTEPNRPQGRNIF